MSLAIDVATLAVAVKFVEVLPLDTLASPWDFVSFELEFSEQFSSLLQDPAFTAKITFI